MDDEITTQESDAQVQDAPVEDETPSETVSVSKAEWDDLQKRLKTSERTISKGKGRQQEFSEVKQMLRDRDNASKAELRALKLEVAGLKNVQRGIDPDETPQDEVQRLKHLFEEEDRQTQEKPVLDPAEVKAWSKIETILDDLDIPTNSKRFNALVAKQAEELGYEPEPSELLPVLQGMKKEADKKAAIETMRLEKAAADKKNGVTGGDRGPSAPSVNLDELRRQFIANPNDPKIEREWFKVRADYYAQKAKKKK